MKKLPIISAAIILSAFLIGNWAYQSGRPGYDANKEGKVIIKVAKATSLGVKIAFGLGILIVLGAGASGEENAWRKRGMK